VALPSARGGRNRRLHLADELARRLVHADYWESAVIRAHVDVEHLFHAGDELGVALRRNHPSYFLPRLELVFFRTRRTVSWEIFWTYVRGGMKLIFFGRFETHLFFGGFSSTFH